jgi:hypothetical protein
MLLQPAWRKSDGNWQPAYANFTSLATPNQLGSGKTALETLLHEGGHAAHFANVSSAVLCSAFLPQARLSSPQLQPARQECIWRLCPTARMANTFQLR